MRTARTSFLALALLAALLAPSPARATRYAGEFLRIGVGARALGMGSAFVGLADDGTASYWNPAGLATLTERQVTAMHAEQFGSIVQYDFLSYVMPVGSAGKPRQAISVSLVRLGVDQIPDTRGLQIIDQNGNGKFDYPEDLLVVDESRFVFDSDNDAALLFSYARDIRPGLSLGGNFKYIRQWLGDSLRSNGFGIDLGLLYVGRSFSLGATLRDATTTRILWNTGTGEYIAPSLRLGAAKTRSFKDRRHLLTGALDIQVGFSDERLSSQAHLGGVTFEFHPGLEYWFDRRLALRAGFEAQNFTAGAGLRYHRLGLDYAFLDHRDLDASHRVSGSYRF
ncbi:MAG TPA: PorV/PorQ family protein [Candidatus Saccharimonadales bacterium]|nr:PorV/PorQ family protein [Candidatus Saccharimonadales bacterium]